MQIKAQRENTSYRVGENVEKLEPSYTVGRNEYKTVHPQVRISLNSKNIITIKPSNSNSRYIPKRTKSIISTQKLVHKCS